MCVGGPPPAFKMRPADVARAWLTEPKSHSKNEVLVVETRPRQNQQYKLEPKGNLGHGNYRPEAGEGSQQQKLSLTNTSNRS